MQYLKFLYPLFALFYFQTNAQTITNYRLKQLIENNPRLSKSFVGVSVYDLKNDKEILAYNSTKNFIPASVLKLLYTLSAIESKGKNYKFHTQIAYTGKILFDGTLQGDLIITPSGDPTFGSHRFYKNGYKSIFKIIKDVLAKSGIRCIEGNIILVLDKQSYPVHGSWTTEDIGNYYAGGSWGLNFNENLYKLKFSLGNKVSSPTKILNINPKVPNITLKNNVLAGEKGTGDNSYIYGLPYDFHREIKGTLPLGKKTFTIKGSIPNPPLSFLRLLGDYFDDNNIYFTDFEIRNNDFQNKTKIHVFESPELFQIVKTCNNWSINLYSESLSQLLCLESNHPADYLYEKEIKMFFKRYKTDFTNAQIVDGCGLSSENHISPKTLTRFIKEMIDELGLFTVIDILPKAGVEGYAKKIPIKNLWIKSGSIQGVLNYSGIFKSKTGKYYSFSFMTNNNNENIKLKADIFEVIRQLIKYI